MATVTSAVGKLLDALVDALMARPGLVGVQVTSGWVGGDTDARETIQLTGARSDQRWGALGNRRREEDISVEGVVFVVSPGKGESAIRAARNRALGLLAEIEDALRTDPTVALAVKAAQLSSVQLDQGATTAGRWCQIDIVIDATADLRSA